MVVPAPPVESVCALAPVGSLITVDPAGAPAPPGLATTVGDPDVDHADGVLKSVAASENTVVRLDAVVFAQSQFTADVWLKVVAYPAFAKVRLPAALPMAFQITVPLGMSPDCIGEDTKLVPLPLR